MKPQTDVLFSSDLWMRALEKYASDTHLSVKLFDAGERVVFGPVHSTPLFNLFDKKGYDPGIFAECARQCLAQTDSRPAVMVSEVYGLAVVGTSLVLNGTVVGAAVGGYAFTDFSQLSEVQRLAKDAGIKFEQLWEVAREQKPVPKHRLMLNGELLQVLGDALLRENYRTRQYEDVVRQLEETARAKDQAHLELQHKALALRESEEQLAKELGAAQQLQSISAMFIEGGHVQVLYQKIVDAAAAMMQSDFASLQMLDGEAGHPGELRLLAQRGFSRKAVDFWEWVRLDSTSSCGAALRNGHRIIIDDVETCDFMAGTDDLEQYRETGMRAVQSTPLLSRAGQLLGMISTHWRAPHAPAESDLLRFDVLARQTADLLEHRQAEAAARALAAIVESSDDAIIGKDLNGIITSWNGGAERLFGYAAHEAVGRPVTMLMPPERINEEPGILERIRRGESIEHYETVRRRKDGTLLDISLTISPIRNSQGIVVGASKVARDITQRKQAEEALRRAVEFDETVMTNMGEGLYTVSSAGLVTSMNPAAERLFGWSVAEIRGRKMHDVTHHHHPDGSPFPANDCPGLQVLKQGTLLFDKEDFFIRKDGSFFPVVFSSAALRSGSGEIVGLVVVFRDITERKQAEAAAREQQERLRKVEKMAAAGQLAASMAHEINNPLSSVTNSLYLLEKHANLDESARFFVTTAATELARVSRIVKQSLSYYRVGTTPRDLNLGEIVKESLKIFSEKIQKARIELKPRIQNSAVLLGFADELRQVIDNLLLNALEAMPRGGSLGISVHDSFDWSRSHRHRKGVRLTIADTGCGIPKEHRWRIFEPFFTTKDEKGTGLGLWVLQGIIAKHEGVMSLRSSVAEPKSGTVVSVFLPSHARLLRKTKPSSAESVA